MLTIKTIETAKDKTCKLSDFESLYLYMTSWKRHYSTYINTLIKLTYSLMFLCFIPIGSKLSDIKFTTSLFWFNKVKSLL